MQINLNHRPEEFPTDGVRSFGELMACVARQAEREGARILKVKLNGEDVTGKDHSLLDSLPLDQIQEIEVDTGDPKVLARSSLYSVADFLEKLLNDLQDTAELLRLGYGERANQRFLRCIDGLQVFMHSLESCRRLLGISFELLFVPAGQEGDAITVAENRRRLFEVLDSMIEAQTNQDWVLLADLLEFELVPVLEDWRQIIPVILKEAQAASSEGLIAIGVPAESERMEEVIA
jgi:hypothetical protein